MDERRTGWRGLPRALRSILRDDAFRRRAANVGHLLSGNLMTVAIGLGTVALAARGLGPERYGILVLIIAYVQAVERFVSFQTWQPIIRYGADLDASERRGELMALLKFGLLLDLAAAVAGALIAAALLLVGSGIFGWSRGITLLGLLYSATLLFNINGTPVAVLRLGGRFRTSAYAQVLNVAVRFLLVLAAFMAGAGLSALVVIWAATQILGAVLLMGFAARELRRRDLHRFLGASLAGVTVRFPGLWRFTWSANLSLTLWSSAQRLDTLIVGALADPAAAGLYNLAKRVGQLAQQVGTQVQAVVYPEITKLWSEGKAARFRSTVVQTEAMLAGFGILMVVLMLVAARPLLYYTAGPAYLAAAPLIVVQMLAVTLTLGGSAMRSALLAMGKDVQVFTVALFATAAFHVSALMLVPQIGPMGANVAHIILGTVWVSGLWLVFRRSLRMAPRPLAEAR